MDDLDYMREALLLARQAASNGEVPIGAVIVDASGEIIGSSFNRRELDGQATHHAEILAIEEACQAVGNWRLTDCQLFVTIEPCVMCAGAISLSRISKVTFGAANPKFGAVKSLYQILTDERLNHRMEVASGLLEEECAGLMQEFFRRRRS